MQNLATARLHAIDLARTLMTPVTLFMVDERQYGVLPSEEIDEEDALTPLCEYDPFELGPAH
jgi:ABC-type branched-subunit amino acid transport system ATPase component